MEKNLVIDIPLKRIGTPEEFGAAVAFVCTPASGYINGINLPVDGGRLQTCNYHIRNTGTVSLCGDFQHVIL